MSLKRRTRPPKPPTRPVMEECRYEEEADVVVGVALPEEDGE